MLARSDVRFTVVLDDPSFTFNASHFLTFPIENDKGATVWAAEPIHGHDFKVSVRIEGPLDESGCVVDFLAAARALRKITGLWNHDLALARTARGVSYATNGDKTRVLYEVAPKLEYVFPTNAIRWLDASNVSTEEIAYQLRDEFTRELDALGVLAYDIDAYTVTLRLEESPHCAVEVAARGPAA